MNDEDYKEIKLGETEKSTIIEFEMQIEKIATDVVQEYQQYFISSNYVLDISMERYKEASRMKLIPMTKEQCFEDDYSSIVVIVVKDLSGNLVGDECDGYLIENIDIFNIYKPFFSKSRGYIINLSFLEIKQQIINEVQRFLSVLSEDMNKE